MEIRVRGKDIESALKALKRQLQKDGLFKDIKKRRFYEKPSVKKKTKSREALRKKMKAQKSFKKPLLRRPAPSA